MAMFHLIMSKSSDLAFGLLGALLFWSVDKGFGVHGVGFKVPGRGSCLHQELPRIVSTKVSVLYVAVVGRTLARRAISSKIV